MNALARRAALIAAAGMFLGCETPAAPESRDCGDATLTPYVAAVQAAILKAWIPPADAAVGTHVVEVTFYVNDEGVPYDVRVISEVSASLAASVQSAFRAADLPKLDGAVAACLASRKARAIFSFAVKNAVAPR